MAKTNLFWRFTLVVAVLVAGSLALMKPAEAAFPGANGKIAFGSARDGNAEIYTMNPDGSSQARLTFNPASDSLATFSPDGKTIAFRSNRDGNNEIYIMNADGSNQRRLTFNSADDTAPAFFPDGKRIAFNSNRDGNFEIYVTDVNGTTPTRLTFDSADNFSPAVSADGKKIAFVRSPSSDTRDDDIFVMNSDGSGTPLNLTQDKDFYSSPTWAPDGRKIAFNSFRDGNHELYVMNPDGSGQIRLTFNSAGGFSRNIDLAPAFSPDGTRIAFESNRDGNFEVYTLNLGNSGATRLTSNPASDSPFDWQPTSATFTVNLTGDARDITPGDVRCDASTSSGDQCTLRAAIEEANASLVADTIRFNIPGSGVRTIKPTSELPKIIRPLAIDGYSQPGSSPNTLQRATNAKPLIELDGSNAGSAAGLRITTSNTVVKGLVINRFSDGIVVSGNDNRVEGNFIGTDPSGTIDLGNRANGVFLIFSTGQLVTSNNTIGGTSPDKRNLISGNSGFGVVMAFDGVVGNRIQGNLIGTKKDAITALGNSRSGVFAGIGAVSNNVVGGIFSNEANTIAFNGEDGVSVAGDKAIGNRILSNSIFSNGDLGIDLNLDGATANDAGDADTGPNQLQNKPAITSAATSGGTTTVQGRLNSTPGKIFTIQFFSNPSGENEGKEFIGTKNVTTDASGVASFTFKPAQAVPVGQTITATAMSVLGDTSEFSRPRTVKQG